ncbi:hypothetical protein KIL84_015430 [Mauremys mutica]|uniref:Uncharacterized protein n=1 Tax=Mauremys mutica TaxID=74926 RepID=A0A9D4APS0_9SAUR|nr:hypothetical protein KIL84_015430 [Mauremys mutica]
MELLQISQDSRSLLRRACAWRWPMGMLQCRCPCSSGTGTRQRPGSLLPRSRALSRLGHQKENTGTEHSGNQLHGVWCSAQPADNANPPSSSSSYPDPCCKCAT